MPQPREVRVVRCDEAVEAIASLAAGDQPTDAAQAGHVASCLRCQAAVVRDRRLVRELRTLRTEHVRPDTALLSSVLVAIDAEAATLHRSRTRKRVAVGSAAATAGGIAIALAARRVRGVLLATG